MPEMTQGIPEFLKAAGVTRFEARSIEGKFLHGMVNKRSKEEDGVSMLVNTNRTPVCRLVTFLHEFIHVLHDDWTEKQVMRDERKVLWMLGIELTEDEKAI